MATAAFPPSVNKFVRWRGWRFINWRWELSGAGGARKKMQNRRRRRRFLNKKVIKWAPEALQKEEEKGRKEEEREETRFSQVFIVVFIGYLPSKLAQNRRGIRCLDDEMQKNRLQRQGCKNKRKQASLVFSG